jgi:hypothetical protein
MSLPIIKGTSRINLILNNYNNKILDIKEHIPTLHLEKKFRINFRQYQYNN